MVGVMSVSPAIVLQLAITVYGLLIVLLGALVAYFSLLSINGKFKPDGWVAGSRWSFSRKSKLFHQDKYWYDINRYYGKRMLYISIPVALIGMAIIVLPADPVLKMYVGNPIVILILLALGDAVVKVLTYRYANRLITQ
jgi:hypothetical protein